MNQVYWNYLHTTFFLDTQTKQSADVEREDDQEYRLEA